MNRFRYGTQLEKAIRESFPDEVRDVWTRTGTAEVATDPMGIEVSDVFITLASRDQWKKARTQDELVQRMAEELEGLPGMRMVFSQPIEMRINEMVAGIRTDLGVKIFGDDLEVLKHKGDRNYYEFTLEKGRRPVPVYTVSLQLKKTDPKKSKFTLNVMADDKTIEKKDRNSLEPLQFYTGKDHMLYELVVNNIEKNRVSGYIATPKSAPQPISQ